MNDFSEDTFDIFNKMFESDPKKRISIDEQMSKEFMKREEIVNEKRNQNVINIEQKMTKMKIDIDENLEHSN